MRDHHNDRAQAGFRLRSGDQPAQRRSMVFDQRNFGRRSRILGLILFGPFQQTLQNKADFSEMVLTKVV
ncbi:MAG: hypothetical protein H6Q43_3687 [Deltaproteobacteria bacterium]|nr:hypothetical protein [Deltaproteobacteria bacterium]